MLYNLRMDLWMYVDGCVDEWMGAWTDGCMNAWMNVCTDVSMMHAWMHEWMHGWIYRRTGGWMDGDRNK